MQKMIIRAKNRSYDELRTVSMSYNAFGYAPASVLFVLGNTKVLCSINMQPNVPPFLKGSKSGWVTAEYAMLPAATHMRTSRESTSVKRNGRAIEISRLIGRCLRTIVDLKKLGERTIIIDCDVLQADGSTRTACITAANYALHAAQEYWLKRNVISEPIVKEKIAAVSVGIKDDSALLDLDYHEDSSIDSDFNIVLADSGRIVEIQGAAEQAMPTWKQFESIQKLSIKGVRDLMKLCDEQLKYKKTTSFPLISHKPKKLKKVPLFSLQNRQLCP